MLGTGEDSPTSLDGPRTSAPPPPPARQEPQVVGPWRDFKGRGIRGMKASLRSGPPMSPAASGDARPASAPATVATHDAELLKSVFDNLRQGVLVLGPDSRVRAFNGWVSHLLALDVGALRIGLAADELIAAAHAAGHYGTRSVAEALATWRRRFDSRLPSQHELALSNGNTLRVAYAPAPDGGWIITYEDVTARIKTARDLAAQNERFDAALTNMPHGLCLFDDDRRLILCNPAYGDLYRLPEELMRAGTPLGSILAHREAVGNGPADMGSYFDVIVEADRKGGFANRRVALQDGRTIRITHNPMQGGYVALHEDITATVRAEEEVRHLGSHDALTGLPNRVSLREKLGHALARVSRERPVAVLCLDLDEFKIVNDTLGHAVGDLLLQAVAERIGYSLGETSTFARLGGDEFVVLQHDPRNRDDAEALARVLVERMGTPFDIEGHDIVVGVSIGIAFCPDDGVMADDVLKKADISLYRAKTDGKSRFRFFESAMDEELQTRRMLELDLRQTVAQNGFSLHYQPLVDAKTAHIRGFEALLRWKHPERGFIPPLEFIPLAEEIGLIGTLGAWALRQACRDAASWPQDVSVAVNLSALQFRDGTLCDVVASALEDAGLIASRLELEITESVLIVDSAGTLATLNRLKALGVRIALDDFGTGYSSLSYLRAFPFDKIKIDKSFIRDLGDGVGSTVIVGAVAGLGAALGINTTAEGVETEEQLARVRQHGCSEVQGFFFASPCPLEAVPALLARMPLVGADALTAA